MLGVIKLSHREHYVDLIIFELVLFYGTVECTYINCFINVATICATSTLLLRFLRKEQLPYIYKFVDC
uniref:Putative secreted protein n=1 Tax=Xenopsylla cheopis TaxID=163159 RepID=A0A6M2DYI9_XENCH